MCAKISLGAFLLLMIWGALHFQPMRGRTLPGIDRTDGARLRLMTWNIGYAELEDDTRAHTSDLKAVAETILQNDPDAVALQELIGADQLNTLLGFLRGHYHGAVARAGKSDRVEALMVKDRAAQFENIPADNKYALATSFHAQGEAHNIIFVSAHADAFSAARRRAYVADIVDWTRLCPRNSIVLIAGDFNFELDTDKSSHLFTDNLQHDSESYSYLLKYFHDLGREAGATALNDRRIDYILGTPDASLIRRAEVLKGAAVGRMDHWPLVVEVAL